MEEINKKIKFMKQRYFEQADKPGKLLGWQIKERRKKTIISKLKVDEEITTNQDIIKLKFMKFFKSLYQNPKVRKEDIEGYLQKIKIVETGPNGGKN